MFFLLAFSGNPFITADFFPKAVLIIYFLFFLVFVATEINMIYIKKMVKYMLLSVFFIGIIVFFQRMLLGFISLPGVLSYLLKIMIGLLTLIYYQYKKVDFLDTYIKVISFLVIISIPFWILNQFEYYGFNIGSLIKKSQIIYTSFEITEKRIIVRNSGMFWEPGAFAGYLITGIIFVALKNRKFQIGPYRNEVYIILLGLLTTMSTTGFIAFGVVLILYSIHNYGLANILVLPLFFVFIGVAYYKLDFLKNKIETQYQEAVELNEDEISAARMGALKMDIQYIKSQPYTGNGYHLKTRYRLHPWIKEDPLQGNGMSNIMAVWGIPFFIVWLICLFAFTWKVSKSTTTTVASVFIIILILQGEQFLNYPLFLSFFFMPFIYDNILSDESKTFLIKSFFEKEYSYQT